MYKKRILSHPVASYSFTSYLTSYLISPYLKKRTVFGKLLRKNGLQTSSHMMTSDKTYDSEAGRLKVTLKSALGNRVPEKLEDKSNKLHAKEHELEQLTKDAAKARSVIQPFRNHKVDFTPPQITEKVPLFGTDKWIERQNRSISKQFTEIVRKIESLYRNDAARQVEAAQNNVLADYGELYQLRRENKTLSDTNENLESELNTLLGQLAIPSVRNMIFAVADALISGQPIPVSSGGGGGNSDSDLRWDGRRPDEEEDEYKRRCLMHAVQVARNSQRKTIRR